MSPASLPVGLSTLGRRLLRKARGIAGLGLVGGALGLLCGGIVALGATIVEVGFYVDAGYWSFLLARVMNSAIDWALPAAFTTTSFGVLLAVADGRRTLLDLPLWRMALFGVLGGSLFLPVYLFARFGLTAFTRFPTLPVGTVGLFAAVGGMLTVSFTAIAKRAHRHELQVVREVELLSGPE